MIAVARSNYGNEVISFGVVEDIYVTDPNGRWPQRKVRVRYFEASTGVFAPERRAATITDLNAVVAMPMLRSETMAGKKPAEVFAALVPQR